MMKKEIKKKAEKAKGECFVIMPFSEKWSDEESFQPSLWQDNIFQNNNHQTIFH